MDIPITGAATAPSAAAGTSVHATATASTAKKEMDQEVFLALLVAQLRNQDPTSPMDTTEMMAQSTQLASMEQLSAMAETSRESFSLQMRIAAGGMVGQQIGYVAADGTPRTGVVESVSFAGPVPMITVDGQQVPLDGVTLVRAASAATPAGTVPAPAAPATTPTSGSAATQTSADASATPAA
ncbi:flagellar hook capping protein [Actinotalea ferrariae]|uniref:flagellar hook assembly protein FlgD n=1 Tax=Actinotalea ferrariae TaxID=1386098 RepID=UPI001C8CC0CD|nr:flagellar hook capping FlgD N-terminal domain-containing protein [Actinotalea ferrariae]MBX9245175.1 flagellar hook capping protein [Actinotalea ferrariae]